MGKPRDLANVVATGNILADGAVAPAELTGVTSTAAEINILDGVTATAAELNLMDGVTATTAELNHVDGVTSNVQTQMDTKAPVASPTFTGTATAPTVNASTALQIGGVAVTATAAELNKMDGVTVSASDINTVTAKAPTSGPTFTGTVTIGGATYPTSDGSAGQVLTTNGSGAVSFTDPAGGGSADFVASGAISNGNVVSLNSDGTVSAVATSSVSAATTSSDVAFTSSNNVIRPYGVYDPSTNKVLIIYRDGANSSYGTAVVGTVSGGTITFGTPVVYNTASSSYAEPVYNPDEGKIVIFYQDGGNSNYLTAKVATISGTTASFSSATVIASTGISTYKVSYDEAQKKFLAVYTDSGNSYRGKYIVISQSGTTFTMGTAAFFTDGTTTISSLIYVPKSSKHVLVTKGASNYGTANVITVSGTSATVGSDTVYEAATVNQLQGITYHEPSGNVVILYSASSATKAIVGSISGESITFGSAATVQSAGSSYHEGIQYHKAADKVILLYDYSSSQAYKLGTVSGTTITVSASIVYVVSSNAKSPSWIDSVYDPVNKKIVSFYATNTPDGSSSVFTPAFTDTNADSYIGVAAAAISNSATGKININGGINEGQSSLDISKTYYVADNGSLQTLNNGRKIGKAISATKLLVNSNMSGNEMNEYLGSLV